MTGVFETATTGQRIVEAIGGAFVADCASATKAQLLSNAVNNHGALVRELERAQQVIELVAVWAGDGSLPPSERLRGIMGAIKSDGTRARLIAKARGEG